MEFKTISIEDRKALIQAMVYGTIYKAFEVEPYGEAHRVVAYFHSGSVQTVIGNVDPEEATKLISEIRRIRNEARLDRYAELLV